MGATAGLIAVASAYVSSAVLLSVGALALPLALRMALPLAARAPERWLALGATACP